MTYEKLVKLKPPEFPVDIRVMIVADDFKGFGVKTKYVGQRGFITGWKDKRNGFGKYPRIKLDSGEVVCNKNIWWDREDS